MRLDVEFFDRACKRPVTQHAVRKSSALAQRFEKGQRKVRLGRGFQLGTLQPASKPIHDHELIAFGLDDLTATDARCSLTPNETCGVSGQTLHVPNRQVSRGKEHVALEDAAALDDALPPFDEPQHILCIRLKSVARNDREVLHTPKRGRGVFARSQSNRKLVVGDLCFVR